MMTISKRFFIEVLLLATLLAIPLGVLMMGCADDLGGVIGTCDSIPPMVTSNFPENHAIDASLNGIISATFSEEMSEASLTTNSMTLQEGPVLVRGKATYPIEIASFISGTVTYNGLTAVFNPSTDLNPNTLYTATVNRGARDLSGNPMVADYVWTFTTGATADVTPPVIISTVPEDSATSVSLNYSITATFSEPMIPATITADKMFLRQGGTVVAGTVTYHGVTATFNPTAALRANSVYTVTINTDVLDLAGNPMAEQYAWSFTTGNAADVTPPSVVFTAPPNHADDVSLNYNLTATFSEPMSPPTITTNNIKLRYGLTTVAGSVTYTGVTATFNPSTTLIPSTVYVVEIMAGVKDLAGNEMLDNYFWTFTTGTAPDITPPSVGSTIPDANDMEVSLNGNLSATFSEVMAPLSITTASMTLHRGLTQVLGTITYTGVTATFNPTGSLVPSTLYTARITNRVRDLAGNAMVNDYVWNFTTGVAPDIKPPTVNSTIPANRAIDVGLGGNFTATFSEPMTPLSVTNLTVTLHQGNSQIPGSVNYNGVTAAFIPMNNLTASTVYTATIKAGVMDLAGNRMTNDYVWTFTTGITPDVTPPSVNSSVPANRAVNVGLGGNLTATFSEAMNPATVTTTTLKLYQGNNQIAGTVTLNGMTASFNPTLNLSPSTDYSVTVTTGVRDLAGNRMADNYVWTFTTGIIPDNTPPSVSSTIPVNRADDVALGGNYTVTFSEAMNPATITTVTVKLTQGINQIQGAVTYNGVTANFNPMNNLTANTVYTATVTSGVRDLAGNAMANNYVWTFTTGAAPDNTPPSVSSTNPVHRADDVALGGNYTVTFTEAMAAGTITAGTITLHQGNNQIQGAVSYNGVTATFNPTNNLTGNTVYTATVTSEVRDLAGNRMADNYVWTFSTGVVPDNVRPTVSSTTPEDEDEDVALDRNYTVTFSEEMAAGTITAGTITLHQGNNQIQGEVSYNGVTATFNPANNLAENTVYTATVTNGVEDLAGNAMANNYVWTFTTGAAPDNTPPSVSSTNPVHRADDVALDRNYTVTFTEAMTAGTITVGTITLHQGNNQIQGAVSYNGVTATFNPTNNLAENTVYTATVTSQVRDLAGNRMADNYVWTFTTGAAPDNVRPTVSSTTPEDEDVDVALDRNYTVTFSEVMAAGTITAGTITLHQGNNQIQGGVSYNGVTATFNPANNLAENTVYTATVTNGVEDLAGNAMAQNYVWTFTTGDAPDNTPPSVSSTTPEDEAVNVALGGNYTVTFSEAMAAGTITAGTITLHQGNNQIQGAVSYVGVTATFNPTNNLAANTVYTATVTNGVEDLAGNAMAQNYVWTFTTGDAPDNTPPSVSSTTPEDEAVNVALGGNYTVTFSEAMAAGTITAGTITLHQGNNQIQGAVSYVGVTATFNPTNNLAANTLYTATVTNGVEDLAGNAMAQNYVWTFTTGAAPDNTPPTVRSVVPEDEATGVLLNANYTVTFSEAMTAGTITVGTITLHQGNNQIQGAVSYAGLVATFNPTNNLVENTLYTATVSTGVRDLAGNALANAFVWTFTTADVTPPTVVSTVPVANAVGVAANINVTATFSEAMTAGTITDQTMTLTRGGNAVAGAVSYAGVVATFNPTNDLASGAVYTATITTGVRDLAGNALANNFVWTFTTLDATPPTVVSTVPDSGAVGVAANINVTATFSEAMAAGTITDQTMTLSRGGNAVAGAVSYAGVVAAFNPTDDLVENTLYTATITTGVRDLAGNALANNFVWTFTTLDATPPTVVSTVPDSGATGVSVNNDISAKFSEGMNEQTITANGTMTLDDPDGNAVQGEVTYADSVATFNPTNPLESGFEYTATITVDAEDLAGNALTDDYVWTFTTGQAGLNLGRAARFAILAHETITNGGHSVITGDIGLSPGERAGVTGFPPGELAEGYAIYAAQDAEVVDGMTDLLTAYNDAAGRAVNRIGLGGGENLAGTTLAPGLYHSETSLAIEGGVVTLDAQGNADAVWIFQMGSTLTLPDDGSGVVLANGAQADNVYWQCGSSATIGTGADFYGNVIVSVSISMGTGATLVGRVLALNGSVTLLENAITVP